MEQRPEETERHNYQRLFLLRNIEIVAIGLGIAMAMLVFDLSLPLQPLLTLLALIVMPEDAPAIKKENIDNFRKLIYEEVKKIHIKRYPYNNFLYHTPEEI